MSSDSGLPASAMHNVTKLFKIKVINLFQRRSIYIWGVSSIPHLCSATAGSANVVISVTTEGKIKGSLFWINFSTQIQISAFGDEPS